MPENDDKYQERLVSLRKEIKSQGLSGYILPRTDEFQSEFLAPYAERLSWLTGFTGSAGNAVILEDAAIVMSDSRYTIQLKQQVPAALYALGDMIQEPIGDWITSHAAEGDKIGFCHWLFSPKQIDKIKEKTTEHGIELVALSKCVIDDVWLDQPDRPSALVTLFPDRVAGMTSQQKRIILSGKLKEHKCDSLLLTVSDSICWLLNVRGADITYSPLVLSYAVLHSNGTLDWFVDANKVSNEIKSALGSSVNICNLENIKDSLSGRVWFDTASAPLAFEQYCLDTHEEKDPCIALKWIKSDTEQQAIRHAHIQDGVALVRFLKWLDEEGESGCLTEISVEDKFEALRRECDSYKEPSFPTISGFGSNGAIVHYRATERSNKTIKSGGLLLVDSGGQYSWGTTDVTRTIAIGEPTQEMKESYTRVLKGHIAVASARFEKGTLGKDIDALARAPLKEVGLDYGHGTGHGVGCYLCVHEDAANISPRGETAFAAGMLISNEPGYYKEGEYGIRIENLVLVQCGGDGCLSFDTVTLAPFDQKLIVVDILDTHEKQWLESYLKTVCDNLSPYLSVDEFSWLESRS